VFMPRGRVALSNVKDFGSCPFPARICGIRTCQELRSSIGMGKRASGESSMITVSANMKPWTPRFNQIHKEIQN
jgi:hypothetical protein